MKRQKNVLRKLSLGAGNIRESGEGWIYIDVSCHDNPNYVWNIENMPWPDEWAGENQVDYIKSDNLFEHLKPEKLIPVMSECWRVLKSTGILWIKVPRVGPTTLDAAFADPTHFTFFTPATFDYFDYQHKRYKVYGSSYGCKPFRRLRQSVVERFIVVELQPLK